MRRKILVTGIGGVVGQGILRNIRDIPADFFLVGTNISHISAGNYLCDTVHQVPYAFDDAYIPAMLDICRKEKIELIIPSTDYEGFYLAKNSSQFACPVAASPAPVSGMCLDKFVTFQQFYQKDIPFAFSILPSAYTSRFEKFVVKPREGRGSRNVFINPEDVSRFDDTYVVQEYLEGPEITTAFYVTQSRSLLGHITFVRELEQGNTAKATVDRRFDREIEGLIQKMITHFEFMGSCNIQARVTKKGIVPFEINCRISGTNSIRSQFGFKDVLYTVQEYLLGAEPEKPNIVEGTALRVVLDIIYPGMKAESISDRNDRYYIR